MTYKKIVSMIILAAATAVGNAVVIVSVSETATLTFTNLPSTTTILSPGGDVLIQKSSNSCTLETSDTRFILLTTTTCDSVVNLQIKSVAVTDAGDYKCSSSSNCRNRLVVLGTPSKPVITASTDDVRLNKDVSLTCKSQSTTKPSDHQITMVYTWIKNGIVLNETDYSLLITKVQKSQFNEKYTCRASERADTKSLLSNAYLLKPKYMSQCNATLNSLTFTSVSVSNGDTITFKCTVDSYPPPLYTYVRNYGRTIQTFANKDTVTITRKLNCSENFSLSCYARNSVGSAYSPSIAVLERCPPQFDPSLVKPVVLRTSNVPAINKYFDIKIVGYPAPDYSVMKKTFDGLYPAYYLELLPRTNYIRLYFRNLGSNVFGDYQLTANNSEGVFTGNFSIKGSLPPAPINVIAWSETPNSVHISWKTPFEKEDLNLASYNLYRKVRSSSWSNIRSVKDSGRIITQVVSSLLPETMYLFMVQSKRGSTYGFYSEMVTVRTIKIGDEPQERPTTIPPGPQQSADSKTPPEPPNTQSPNITAAGIGIGIAIGVVIIVIVAGIAMIIYKNMNKPKNSNQTSIDDPVIESAHSENQPTYDRPVHNPGSVTHIYSNLQDARNATNDVGCYNSGFQN